MRIAMVAPPWIPVPPPGYGGTERVVALLTDGLVERGHDVTLYAPPGSGTKATVVSPLPTVPEYVNADPDDEAAHVLAAHIDAREFDLVHDHTSLGPVIASSAPSGPPVVHTLHGPWRPGLRRKLALASARVHLVAISRAQRSSAPDFRYAGVVHNGIDVDAHPFVEHKQEYVCFVGRVSPAKGPGVAIDVARRAGRPITMVVKCTEPDERAYWNEHVRPRLGADVTVLEEPTEAVKTAVMANARALISPINWPEPFGLVLVEAMACGTPVITRPLGAAPELIVPDVTGMLCDSVTDMVAAVDAIESCSPAECRAHAARTLSASVMVDGYESLYERLLRGGASRVA